MSNDLSSVLHGFADDQSRAAAAELGDPTARTQIITALVHRRRARHLTGAVAAAVALVVAGTLAANALTPPPPPEPAVPVPSTTPSATTSPSASPTPTPAETLPAVTVRPGFPAAVPLAPGVIERSALDWHLVLARDSGSDLQVLYLVEPTGTAHEVPSPIRWGERLLVDWLPSSSLALVAAASDRGPEMSPGPSAPWQVVDLLSGEVVSDVTVPADASEPEVQFAKDGTTDLLVLTAWFGPDSSDMHAERRLVDGTVVASAESPQDLGNSLALSHISPDRRTVLLRTDTHALRRTSDLQVTSALRVPRPEQPHACSSTGWLDDTHLAYYCHASGELVDPDDGGGELWSVPADGSDPTLVLAGEVYPDAFVSSNTDMVSAGGRVFVQLHPREPEDTTTVVRVEADGSTTPFSADGARIMSLVGDLHGRLLATVLGEEGFDLVTVDVETGESSTVFPAAEFGSVYLQWFPSLR